MFGFIYSAGKKSQEKKLYQFDFAPTAQLSMYAREYIVAEVYTGHFDYSTPPSHLFKVYK